MADRILILGGTGFVGDYVRRELAADHEVETTSTSGAGATFAFDVTQPAHYARVLGGGYRAVVNCSVRRAGSFAELYAVNVTGLAGLLLALRDAPLHFVQVSSFSGTLANRHATDYGRTKFLGDELVDHLGGGRHPLRGASLRFGQIFDVDGRSAASQPGLHQWVARLRAGERIRVFAHGGKRSYLPVQLVARAIRHALATGLGGVHDVVAADAYTPVELARLLAAAAGAGEHLLDLDRDARAFDYEIPACSPQLQPWLAQQEACSSYFQQLVHHG